MNIIRTEPLPFSDYVIFYFVDIFGVEWLDFYHAILVGIITLTISSWIFALRIYFNCKRDIKEVAKEEQSK